MFGLATETAEIIGYWLHRAFYSVVYEGASRWCSVYAFYSYIDTRLHC